MQLVKLTSILKFLNDPVMWSLLLKFKTITDVTSIITDLGDKITIQSLITKTIKLSPVIQYEFVCQTFLCLFVNWNSFREKQSTKFVIHSVVAICNWDFPVRFNFFLAFELFI